MTGAPTVKTAIRLYQLARELREIADAIAEHSLDYVDVAGDAAFAAGIVAHSAQRLANRLVIEARVVQAAEART